MPVQLHLCTKGLVDSSKTRPINFSFYIELMFVYSIDEVRVMDRGNKLWEGHRVILPEHRDLLFERRQKEQEFHLPELTEDQMEEISRLIAWSKIEERAITLTYAERYGPKQITGVIIRVNPIERWLIIESEEDRRMIPFTQIIGAEEV